MTAELMLSWLIVLFPILALVGFSVWRHHRYELQNRYTKEKMGGSLSVNQSRKLMEILIQDALANPYDYAQSRNREVMRNSSDSTRTGYLGLLETDKFVGEELQKFYVNHRDCMRMSFKVWFDEKNKIVRCRIDELETGGEEWQAPNWKEDVRCDCCPDQIIANVSDHTTILKMLAELPATSFMEFEELVTEFLDSARIDMSMDELQLLRNVRNKIDTCNEKSHALKKWHETNTLDSAH